MLYDYSIREEDRQDYISALAINIMSIYADCTVGDKLLLRLLYNRAQFGGMPTLEIYGLLIKCAIGHEYNPFRVGIEYNRGSNAYHAYNTMDSEFNIFRRTRRMLHGLVETEEEDVDPYVPFQPPEPIPGKSGEVDDVWETALAHQLIGRVIYQDMAWFEQYPIVQYIDPVKVEFFVPKKIIGGERFPVLAAFSNLPNLLTYKYQSLPHPQ